MEIITLSQPNLRTQLRALYVIALKDWKVFWRYPLNAASNIFQPIIWITPVYFMGKAFSVNGQALGFAAYSGTSDYMSFILLGTVLTNFIMTVFWGMGYALKNDMDAGVLESNWLTPVPRLLILVGRTLSSLLVTAITSAIMLALGGALFGFHPTGNTLAAFLTAIPMLIGLYGFGFAFAAIVLLMREANTLVDVSSFLVLPLTYGLDAVRGLLLQTDTLLPIQVEIAIPIIFMFVLLWFGAWVFNRVERRVRTLGTLGQH
jgi:ABC-2 type transport system permease protein